MATPIVRLDDEDAARDARITLLEALVLSELSPATRALYRELDDLRFDRSIATADAHAAALALHFPGFTPAIAATWLHVIAASSNGRCCELVS